MKPDPSPPTIPGRRDARRRERRDTIVSAAREAFLSTGYAAMSMSNLQQTLGGSKSTLWRYFPSKEALFAAVLEDAAEELHGELADILATDMSLEEGVNDFARTFIATIGTPQALALWRLVAAEGERFPELGRLFYERAGAYPEEMLAHFLQKFIAVELRDEDPREMAEVLISLCATHMQRQLFGISGDSAQARVTAARRYAEIFLRAFSLQEDERGAET